jgi:hypothetical protein
MFVLKYPLHIYLCCSHNFGLKNAVRFGSWVVFSFGMHVQLFTAVIGKGAFLNGQRIYGQ